MKEHIQDILVGGRPMTKLEQANKEIERLNNIITEIKELVDNYEQLEKTLGAGKPTFQLYKLQKILKEK